MITRWMASNFKSISEETELEIAPLTIFAGANSSGKSTFIQSILLVAQTLSHKDISRPVILNGSLASLGQFNNLKSNSHKSDNITVKFTCQPQLSNYDSFYRFRLNKDYILMRHRTQIKEIGCEFSFGVGASSSSNDFSQIQPRLFSTELFCKSEEDVNQKTNIKIHYSTKEISEYEESDDVDAIDKQLRETLHYPFELVDDVHMKEGVETHYSKPTPRGCKLRHFLPYDLVYDVDSIEEDANETTFFLRSAFYSRRRLGKSKSDILLSEEVIAALHDVFENTSEFDPSFRNKCQRDLLISSESNTFTISDLASRLRKFPREEKRKVRQIMQNCEDLFERIHEAMRASMIDGPKSDREYFYDTPSDLIIDSAQILEHIFTTKVKYLGPLRDAPKPLFPFVPVIDLDDVGLRGEHTASVLELYKNERVPYIQSSSFKSQQIDDTKVTATLEQAVVDWLRYLEVANSVKSEDKGELGHELKVGFFNSDSMHDLTHVGVGVSQVLPILVMCLLAGSGSTLIIEQPELHLHPKVQTLLGDFFISMTLCNKQCIVETHSEYLIDRIRFRIAATSSEKPLNDRTKIYFVEKPSQSSSFREVVVNEYGAIQDWPEGFFDQSPKQAHEILTAAMKKRKVNQKI